jgi:hypothetical protein
MLIFAGHAGHAETASLSANAEIVIGQQPQNVTVLEARSATFTVEAFAVGTEHDHLLQPFLEYQWQRDSVDIEGATSRTYQTGLVTLADNGAEFRVLVFLSGCAIEASDPAVLTVQQDLQPPEVVSAAAIEGSWGQFFVGITFDKGLDPTTAQNTNHYLVDGMNPSSAVLLEDGVSVQLRLGYLPGPNFTLSVNGVQDLLGNTASTSAQGKVLRMKFEEIGGAISGSEGSTFTSSEGTYLARTAVRGLRLNWDTVHFIYEQITGDFDIVVQFTEMDLITNSARGGLMFRDFLSPGSRNYWIGTYPDNAPSGTNKWVATMRAESGGATVTVPDSFVDRAPGFAFPNAWVRLQREGNIIRGFYSTDAVNWTQLGADQAFGSLPDTLYVGMGSMTSLAAENVLGNFGYANYGSYNELGAQFASSPASHSPDGTSAYSSNQSLNTQAAVDFDFEDATVVIHQGPQSITLEEGREGMFSVQASAEGSSDDRLRYQWQRNGVDIPGATSSTYIVPAASMEDDGAGIRVVVFVPGCSMVTSEAATLNVYPDAIPPQIVSTASLDGLLIGICFDEQLDPVTAENPAHYTVNGGGVVTAAKVQPNGQAVQLTISGLSATSYTVNVNGVRDLFGNPANTSAEGPVLGMTVQEIGSAAAGFPGSAFACSADVIRVRTAVRGLRTTADNVHFIHEQLSGDFDLSVRFADMIQVNSATRGGILVRESLDQNSRYYFVGTYPETSVSANRWVVTARLATGAADVILPDSYVEREPGFAFPNAWVRLKRESGVFSAYYSTNGVTWTQIGESLAPDSPYPDTVYAGLASMTAVAGANVYTDFEYWDYGAYVPVVETDMPLLSILRSGNDIVLGWPTWAEGFSLYSSEDLVTWNPVAADPVTEGEFNVVTLPAVADRMFFRLQK